jgi:hypothetical protein
MRDLVELSRARLAWRGAIWATALTVVGSPFELMAGRAVPGMPSWPPLATAALGVAVLVVLLANRRSPTREGAAAAFLVNAFAVSAMFFLVNGHWAELGARWAPFQGNKLGALAVGFLTPELWVGAVSILAYCLSALVQWVLLAPDVRARLAAGEPWVTLVFGFVAMALLVQSSRRYALERKLLRSEHEAQALDRLARSFRAVRDFANTPLQTIELATALLRTRCPDSLRELEIVERALGRLRVLDELLSRYDRDARWRTDDESFDAEQRLARAGDHQPM